MTRGEDQLAFDFGVCALADYDEDGHAQVATDSPGVSAETGTQPAEVLMPYGFHGRPLDPEKDEGGTVGLGAPCLVIVYGNRRFVLPLSDPRDVIEGRLPKLRKGGAMMAGGAGDHRSFISIDGEDPSGEKQPGSLQLFASYSKSGAKRSLAISMNVRDVGEEDISLVHGDGARYTVDKDGHSLTSPDGKSFFSTTNKGNTLAGKTKVQGSLTVGDQLSAQAVPLSPVLKLCLAAICAGGGAAAATMTAALQPFLALLDSKHTKTT